jgi:nitrate reductase NapE component
MGWLRPALAALFGLVIASAAGLLVLPVLVLVDPVTRDASYALVEAVLQVLGEAEFDPFAAAEADAVLRFLYAAVIAIGFFPIVVVAIVGALGQLRSWTFLAGATGTVTAAMPWVLRSAYHLPRTGTASAMEMRFALVLFLTGIVVGSVFWFVAATFGGSRGGSHGGSHGGGAA